MKAPTERDDYEEQHYVFKLGETAVNDLPPFSSVIKKDENLQLTLSFIKEAKGVVTTTTEVAFTSLNATHYSARVPDLQLKQAVYSMTVPNCYGIDLAVKVRVSTVPIEQDCVAFKQVDTANSSGNCIKVRSTETCVFSTLTDYCALLSCSPLVPEPKEQVTYFRTERHETPSGNYSCDFT